MYYKTDEHTLVIIADKRENPLNERLFCRMGTHFQPQTVVDLLHIVSDLVDREDAFHRSDEERDRLISKARILLQSLE